MGRVLYVMMLTGFVAVTGCDQKTADQAPGRVTSEDVRRDVDHAVDTAAKFSQQAKEEFQMKLDARIKELDVEIDKLREKGRELTDEAKVSWDQKMADLEKKRDAARAKLDEVGRSSAEAWKDIQKGAKSAWDELDKAFKMQCENSNRSAFAKISSRKRTQKVITTLDRPKAIYPLNSKTLSF